jgi:hypothetical protein
VSSTPVNLVSSRGSSPQPNTNLQLTVAAAPSTTARVPLLSRTPASSANKKKKGTAKQWAWPGPTPSQL